MDSTDDVSQKRAELERCLPGHDGRDVALCRLAAALYNRFKNEQEMDDLNEAITLYRAALELRPAGHPDRALSLHDLAQCIADRSPQEPPASDVDEIILLEHEAVLLLEHGDPVRDACRRRFAAYVQLRAGRVAMKAASDAADLDVKQRIRNAVFDVLYTMPTRLLHTGTGILCNRDAQVSDFMCSERCERLVSLCKTCNRDQQIEHIRTEISKHFQYVMLSHRWGKGEPSLHDIEGQNIYIMSPTGGIGKLQGFCVVARERDYLWAWSDTCCIDKQSSAEVQETIGSMFAWYRQSTLTAVHLSDVPDTCSFENSEWFRRGWTLAELLAPRTVLFFTQNWSLYKNITSSNHKTEVTVLEELERATGIESRFLTDFSPGMGDARLRLQWASLRRTTLPEDIAYSLFGLFNIHLPIHYGESAENALGRLLAEIISNSGGLSVLDWVGESSPFHSCFPAHITSYRRLPAPPPQPIADEWSSAIIQGFSLFEVLRNLCSSLATSLLPRFLSRPIALLIDAHRVLATQQQTPDSCGPSDVDDFRSPTRAPHSEIFTRPSRLLILSCIAYHVIMVQLKRADPSTPSCTYDIQASGLMPLEITLPSKLEDVTRLPGTLHLVRPWYSKLLAPFTPSGGAATGKQLFSALGSPFHALLLTELPHNEHRRIASSTPITAQPIGRASILKSKVRMFHVV